MFNKAQMMIEEQMLNNSTSAAILPMQCYVQLIRCKNNHKAFYSTVCPFCGEVGKRPFRYNSKLKVGKSYCCGVSFKDISWFKTIMTNRDKYEVKRIQDDVLLKNENKKYFIDKYFKDKMSIKQSGFEKSDLSDLSLPF